MGKAEAPKKTVKRSDKNTTSTAEDTMHKASGQEEKAKTIARKDKNATIATEAKPKGVARTDKNKTSTEPQKVKQVKRTAKMNQTSTSLGLEAKNKQSSRKKGGAGGAFQQSSTTATAPKKTKPKVNTAHQQSTHKSTPAPKAKNTSHMQSSFTFG